MTSVEQTNPDPRPGAAGEAVAAPPRPAARRPGNRRLNALLAAAATVLALGFGFAAPSVSAVGPAPTVSSVVSQASGPVVQAAPVPALPVTPTVPSGADRRGGQLAGRGGFGEPGRHR